MLIPLSLVILLHGYILNQVSGKPQQKKLLRRKRTIVFLILQIAIITLLIMGNRPAAFGFAVITIPFFYKIYQIGQQQRRQQVQAAFTQPTAIMESEFVILRLNHNTRSLGGEVRQGLYAGIQLGQLRFNDLMILLAQYRHSDPRSASLLMVYLDNTQAIDWRQFQLEFEQPKKEQPARMRQKMSNAEAREILGVDEHADEDIVKQAHRKLMMKIHPDAGGTDYLAAKVNEAKDLLLGKVAQATTRNPS